MIVPITAAERQRLGTEFKAMLDQWLAATPDGQRKYDYLQTVLAEDRKTEPQ